MELKNGVEKASQKKMFPGYVLLHMDADNNDAWYVVRNTRGVTGFVGPGSKPVPLTEAELEALNFGVDTTVEFSEGDVINVTAGVWKDTVGCCSGVKLFCELSNIYAMLSKSRTNWWSWCCFCGRNL